MKLYPALKMKMGTWNYYVVRMRMADVAAEIRFASEVNDDKTLDKAIQRTIETGRARKQIVRYLQINEERFFGSLVVAALDGNPEWFGVDLADDKRFEMMGSEISDCFGVLRFDDTIKTYALDGQHRLFAIRELVEAQADNPPPDGFSDETISVIYVVPEKGVPREDFQKSYRRVFSALNRHAKTTHDNTNIIMDEDDRYAIVTRRLISQFEFFEWDGDGDANIDTEQRSEALSTSSNSYATIVGLYKMNVRFLWTRDMTSNHGNPLSGQAWNNLIQDCPEDDDVDQLYNGLEKIWDGLLLILPQLREEPVTMRKHGHEYGDGENDSLLFWPIGQTLLLAPIVRRLLSESNIDLPDTAEEVREALKPLSLVPWDLKHSLWRDFLLVYDNDRENWRMRSADRNECLQIGYSILLWITGCELHDAEGIDELSGRWSARLMPLGGSEREQNTFDELIRIREEILDL